MCRLGAYVFWCSDSHGDPGSFALDVLQLLDVLARKIKKKESGTIVEPCSSFSASGVDKVHFR